MSDFQELPTEDQEPGDLEMDRQDEDLNPLQHMLSGLLLAAQEAHGEDLPPEAQVAMSEFFAYGAIGVLNTLVNGYAYPSGAKAMVSVAQLREYAEEIIMITSEGLENDDLA